MAPRSREPEQAKKSRRRSAPKSLIAARKKRILRDALGAVLLTMALAGLKDWTEETPRFAFLKEYLYGWLQFNLQPQPEWQNIVVLDFLDVPMTNGYTSRKALRNVVNQVIESGPRAIGLDVDFSPTAKGVFYSPEDEAFLNFCSDQRKQGHNLFVGVESSLKFGPQFWLVKQDYQDLAAYIGRVNPSEYGPNHKMDEWIKIPGSENQVPSLSEALATAYLGHKPEESPRWPEWMAQNGETDQLDQITYREFWVDFSPIDYFRDTAIRVNAGGNLPAHRLANKIVLLGRGLLPRGQQQADASQTEATDRFAVPGHAELYAGVLLHACATYTLLNRNLRLYHLTDRGELFVDFLFSLAVFGIIACIRWLHIHDREEVNVHRLSWLFTLLALVVVFAIAEWMLNVTRLIWDDYLLIMLVLLIHFWIESREERASRWMRERWRGLVFEKPSGPGEAH